MLGGSEDYGSERAPIDYEARPFAARLSAALDDDRVRASVVGLGVDPLTFATDLLTVVTFEAAIFDELFVDLVDTNSEGQVVRSDGGALSFTTVNVDHFVEQEPMQAAGAAFCSGWPGDTKRPSCLS